jgi:hypothetical protein
MTTDSRTITLTAADVAALDVTAVRARGAAAIRAFVASGESEADATEAVTRNLECFIEHLEAHPTLGAVRFHVRVATIEVTP